MVNPGVAESLRRVGRDLRSWTAGEAAPVLAARAAAGIAAAMLVVQLLGLPAWGESAIIGAWLGGVGLLTPGTRTEPGVPLLIGLSSAGGLLLGSLGHPVLLVAAAAVYALVLTFISSISQATGVMLTVSGIPFFLADDLTEHAAPWAAAAAVCAGAAVQALGALLPPRYRWAHDRGILAGAWLALADEAEALAGDPNAPFATEALAEAARELDRRRALPASVKEARAQIYAVSAAIGRVASARARADAREADTVAFHSEALLLAARLLRHFADEITARSPAALDWDELLEGLARHPVATSTGTIPTEISGLLRTLHDTEGYASRIATGSDDVIADPALAYATGQAREAFSRLRGRLHRRDPVVHHSLRRAGVIALATGLGFAWPSDHGYWIPLTAWIVLQADFAGTLTRGVTRALGTFGGVVAASLLSLVVPHEPVWLSLAVLVFSLLAYWVRPVSMLVFAAAVAAFTVFQIDLSGDDPLLGALDRGVSTAIGASLAIGFYMLAPTWQTRRLGDLLAELVNAYSDYARLALDRQAHPGDYDAKLMHAVIDAVRAKRAALATAADQAKAEPVTSVSPLSADALGAEEALSRAGRALVAVNASVSKDEAAALPGVEDFAAAVEAAYRRLAALAAGAPSPGPVDLSEAARRLDAELAEGDKETRTRRNVMRWELDNLVEALDDAGLLMAGWNTA
ncbi:FUSC family protein [Glycomyces arizonensis]|uniref:FUSC family protein n=1 Tax=Glycomyces arizonensis TaxID=256035 RepID=UPI000417627F|nr:FUSC family protein [Glycomyces arizonensis]